MDNMYNVHPHVHRTKDNMGRTIGLHEEQAASQEQGISVGFGKRGIECHLPPSDDRALRRLIKRYSKSKKQRSKTINIQKR